MRQLEERGVVMNAQELALKVIGRFGGQNNAAKICGLSVNAFINSKRQNNRRKNINNRKAQKGLKTKGGDTMNALNIFLATAGFIITMFGVGVAIIRGAEWAIKE